MSDVETLKSTHFPEKYVFFIKQQLDAKDASKGSFEQRVILCHRGFDRPTVLVTEGYNAKYALREGYIEELSKLFDTNIITVEYRYFDKSMPSPCNWDYLTVENSLYDLHHVNQTLHAMYKGKWIATGISKGGQTTMFYRAYFPNDVDVSVPYVAPLNKGVEDGRHEKFLQHEFLPRRTDRRCSTSSCCSSSARLRCCRCSRSIAARSSIASMRLSPRFSITRCLSMPSPSGSGGGHQEDSYE